MFPLGVCTAQGREWIVDNSNRPGTHFRLLRDAFAAARPGDLVRVRDGYYNAAPLNKGLVILCEPGVRLGPEFYRGLTILDVPAGQQVVVQGFELLASVEVRNCQGRVILDRLRPTAGGGSNLSLQNASHVQLTSCEFSTVAVSSSVASLTNCTVSGAQIFAKYGLRAQGSEVMLAFGTVRGDGPLQGVPAIVAEQTQLTILGDASTVIAAGMLGTGPVPAIQANGGSVVLDPNVQVRGFAGPPITGTAAVTFRRFPALRATGAAPGGVIRSELFSPAGDIAVVFVSLAAERTSAGGPGADVWLDLNLFVLLGVGVQNTGEHLPMSLPVPNDASLAFLACTQQAVSVTPVGGFSLSNPASYAHR